MDTKELIGKWEDDRREMSLWFVLRSLDNHIAALEAQVKELETRSIRRIEMLEDAVFAPGTPSPAPEPSAEVKTIPVADYDMAVRQLHEARNWTMDRATPTDTQIRRAIDWALVALGQDIPN